MTEAGATLSTILGGNKEASETKKGKKVIHKSPTTNSYAKCIDALSGKFTDSEIKMAHAMIERHDRNSFTEEKEIGTIYEEVDGIKKKTKTKMLTVKGTYSFAVFAHLKTIEMWIEYKDA